MSQELKKRMKVKFTARKDVGEGVIEDILDTARGQWFQVKANGTGKTYRLRACYITPL